MPERKLSYQEYRRLREAYPDDGVSNDQDFYLNEEEKPETDALMAQYEEMQADLLNAKPATSEYQDQMQDMTGVMDQLAEINPTNSVRGELQRLMRLSQPVDISQYPQVAAEQTMSDAGNQAPKKTPSASDRMLGYGKQAGASQAEEEPDDEQAYKDVSEIIGVYGLKLGSIKGKPAIQKKGMTGGWTETFPDYTAAKKWLEANVSKLR